MTAEETPVLRVQPNITPNPDPTERTVEALEQRIGDLQRLINVRFESGHEAREALKETIGVRIIAIEHSLQVFQDGITRVPTDVDKRVDSLKELHERQFGERFDAFQQQFAGVQRQLEERDKRADQTSVAAKEAVNTAFLASKEAVAAALQAQKEQVAAQNQSFADANTKTENTTAKLLEGLSVQINTTTNALKEKIDGLERRLTTIEGRGVGTSESRTESRQQGQWLYGAAIAGLSMLLTIGALIYAALKP